MEALSGSGGGVPLRVDDVAPRTRPGDAPAWLELNLTRAEIRELRARAAARRCGVDAWLNVQLEFRITSERLTSANKDVGVVVKAASAGGVVLLPPGPLRRWAQLMEGAATELPNDELPSVVVAQRLANQVPHARLVRLLEELGRDDGDGDDARACELAAARTGQSMEAWMLATALAASSN